MTGRVITVEESPRRGGIGAEIAAMLVEEAVDLPLAPVRRVAASRTPAPFSPPHERSYIPGVERIAAAARELIEIS